MDKLIWDLIPDTPTTLQPMFCPNSQCKNFHDPPEDRSSWIYRYGFYQTKCFGKVPRFRCRDCRRTFSTQTFSIDYYAKCRADYIQILKNLAIGGGLGDLVRLTGLREETVQNRIDRMSRACLAISSELREQIPFEEDFVLDGFESFAGSQYYPNNINILVGSKTEMIHGMGLSVLRRKGRMTEDQKKKREVLEQKEVADPKDTHKSVASLMKDLCKNLKAKQIDHRLLYTDEHGAYPQSIKMAGDAATILEHHQISSRKPRSTSNQLFPVNYVDRQFRKDLANHHRETVQYSRCPQAMMSRLTVYQLYHNYISPQRVRRFRRGDKSGRGLAAGLSIDRIRQVMRDHWGRRPFLAKTSLWEEERKTWLQKWRNPGVKFGRYIPKYAAA